MNIFFFLCCQRKKQRELLGIGTPAMLPTHTREKTVHTTLSHISTVFSTHASPLPTMPPIPSLLFDHSSVYIEIVGYCAGQGFNRRVFREGSLRDNFGAQALSRKIDNTLTPKLTGRAVGIESVRYDFERFLWLLSFAEGIPLGVRKESNVSH